MTGLAAPLLRGVVSEEGRLRVIPPAWAAESLAGGLCRFGMGEGTGPGAFSGLCWVSQKDLIFENQKCWVSSEIARKAECLFLCLPGSARLFTSCPSCGSFRPFFLCLLGTDHSCWF